MTGPVVQLSADLEHAGRISGAGNLATMGRIVLPILRPALLGGLILAFITYMREFTLSVLLFRSGTEVITTVMYSFYNNGRLPFVATIANTASPKAAAPRRSPSAAKNPSRPSRRHTAATAATAPTAGAPLSFPPFRGGFC